MSGRWILLACFLVAAVLFFAANRPAYKGYFSDDDLDNLGWPAYVDNAVYYHGLLTLKLDAYNFRPVGDLYYRYLYRTFHLNYRPYVAVLQLLHALNVILLFFVLGRLGFSEPSAGAGALFYAFHAAVLEAYWKPMYIFDVLCGTLCLAALLLYIRGRWILALLPFWLAYKSKEIAIMLPVALLAYELWLGRRKWKRLIPYFVISLSFGLQALWWNSSVSSANAYALEFSPQALWKSIAVYSSSILFLPYAGLALLLLPVLVRDRRLYLGLVLMAATFVPLLALSGRIHAVYWYVPMMGLAIAVAAVAARAPRWAIALFFVLWFPVNYMVLREKRREILAIADENRWYTTGLLDYARLAPALQTVVYDGIPAHVSRVGVAGAIHLAFGPKVNAVWYHDPGAAEAMAQAPMAMVSYYPVERQVRGLLRRRNVPGDQSYIRFSHETLASRLGSGWYDGAAGPRGTEPSAELSMYRPAGASEWEVVASPPPDGVARDGPARVTVFENGKPLGSQTLSGSSGEPQALRWKLQPGNPGVTGLRIVSEPSWRAREDSRELGIAVYAIGYVSP